MTTPTTTDAQPDPPRERVLLTLESLPSDRPIAVRLRLVLKELLRRQQFKCVEVTELKGGTEIPADPGEEGT
jgi:hypothetical protein